MNQTMFVIVQATTTLDLYRVGADIEQGIDWDFDTDSSSSSDDDDDKTYTATRGKCPRKPTSRPGSSKHLRRGKGGTGGRRRQDQCGPDGPRPGGSSR